MLFGSRAPLWKYVLGIIALSYVARTIGVAVVLHLAQGPAMAIWGLGVQAVAGLVIAIALFSGARRLPIYCLFALGLAMLGFALMHVEPLKGARHMPPPLGANA